MPTGGGLLSARRSIFSKLGALCGGQKGWLGPGDVLHVAQDSRHLVEEVCFRLEHVRLEVRDLAVEGLAKARLASLPHIVSQSSIHLGVKPLLPEAIERE